MAKVNKGTAAASRERANRLVKGFPLKKGEGKTFVLPGPKLKGQGEKALNRQTWDEMIHGEPVKLRRSKPVSEKDKAYKYSTGVDKASQERLLGLRRGKD